MVVDDGYSLNGDNDATARVKNMEHIRLRDAAWTALTCFGVIITLETPFPAYGRSLHRSPPPVHAESFYINALINKAHYFDIVKYLHPTLIAILQQAACWAGGMPCCNPAGPSCSIQQCMQECCQAEVSLRIISSHLGKHAVCFPTELIRPPLLALETSAVHNAVLCFAEWRCSW